MCSLPLIQTHKGSLATHLRVTHKVYLTVAKIRHKTLAAFRKKTYLVSFSYDCNVWLQMEQELWSLGLRFLYLCDSSLTG